MREGSAPNFCPPTEEGVTLVLEDETGEQTELEFLGLILHHDRSYGFFFPVTEDEPVGSSGEVVLLEVTELDEDGQPAAFESSSRMKRWRPRSTETPRTAKGYMRLPRSRRLGAQHRPSGPSPSGA